MKKSLVMWLKEFHTCSLQRNNKFIILKSAQVFN